MNQTPVELANSYEFALHRAIQIFIALSENPEDRDKVRIAKKLVNQYDALMNLWQNIAQYDKWGEYDI